MRNRFEGKNVVVTGGNSGLGLSAARAFAEEGARVVITGRDEATLAWAAKDIGRGAISVRCDTSDLPQIDLLAAQLKRDLGHVDSLFVNAGIGVSMPLEEVTEAAWDQVMNINLKGLFFTVQKVVPLMGTGASIVLNLSAAQALAPTGASLYAASKAGGRSLTRTLGHELVGRGIRVNSVSPGPIDGTEIVARSNWPAEMHDTVKQGMANAVPMKRMGMPSEVDAAVLFLASDDASFITGEDLLISGGQGIFF